MPARALVIDDSRATRTMLRRILDQLGYSDTIEAADGREALDQLDAHAGVELALVDWNMPVMDGLEFLRSVRAEARWRDLALVMVTTESEIEHMIEALEAGADEYVMKPFTPAVLREKLQLIGLGGAA